MPIRAFLRHHWPAITITVTAAAIGCAAFVMLRNMPPHRIVMATGPEGSAYEEDGKRYQAALAKAGVEVQLRSTAGSVETAELLRDPRSGVSVGLIQGGVVGVMHGGGGGAGAPRRRARRAVRLSPRRRGRRALSLSHQGDRAQRRDGFDAGPTARGRDPDGNQDHPGGAGGPASGHSVPAAQRREGDPFG